MSVYKFSGKVSGLDRRYKEFNFCEIRLASNFLTFDSDVCFSAVPVLPSYVIFHTSRKKGYLPNLGLIKHPSDHTLADLEEQWTIDSFCVRYTCR